MRGPGLPCSHASGPSPSSPSVSPPSEPAEPPSPASAGEAARLLEQGGERPRQPRAAQRQRGGLRRDVVLAAQEPCHVRQAGPGRELQERAEALAEHLRVLLARLHPQPQQRLGHLGAPRAAERACGRHASRRLRIGQEVRRLHHRARVVALHERHQADAAQLGRAVDLAAPHRLHLHVAHAGEEHLLGLGLGPPQRLGDRRLAAALRIALARALHEPLERRRQALEQPLVDHRRVLVAPHRRRGRRRDEQPAVALERLDDARARLGGRGVAQRLLQRRQLRVEALGHGPSMTRSLENRLVLDGNELRDDRLTKRLAISLGSLALSIPV